MSGVPAAAGSGSPDSYLAPICRPSTLDSFGNRSLILAALKAQLGSFSGVVLDLGCGHKPYRNLLLSPPSRATRYIGVDLPGNPYSQPDLEWDGSALPLADASVDCVLMTEVLEHCPEPLAVLGEVFRVLRPAGFLFLTVPFIWPMHTVPHDEFRYTPFALDRLLRTAGFGDPRVEATGGRNAALAVMLGLWARRRTATTRLQLFQRKLWCTLLWPLIWLLLKHDRRPEHFEESTLVVGFSAAASKPS